MPIKNETLRRKLEQKVDQLAAKIQPWQDELDMCQRMLAEMSAHEAKLSQAAESRLGLTENPGNED